MSDKEKFLQLKRAELDQAADFYLVDISDARNKGDVVDALQENGITWETYAKNFAIEQEVEEPNEVAEAAEEPEEEIELLFFQGRNAVYEIAGLRFTRDHPYAPVSRQQADRLTKQFPQKFRRATLEEVENYYS